MPPIYENPLYNEIGGMQEDIEDLNLRNINNYQSNNADDNSPLYF